MPRRKTFINPTDEGKSDKAHIPPPPRKIAPRGKVTGGHEREIGLTLDGGPALEKK